MKFLKFHVILQALSVIYNKDEKDSFCDNDLFAVILCDGTS